MHDSLLGEIDFQSSEKRLGGINPNHPDFDVIGSQFVQLLIDYAGLRPKSRVLDIGCGTGRLTKALLKMIKPTNYFGCDVNKSYIDYCKATYLEANFQHLDYYHPEFNPKGNSLDWPYKESFDLIISIAVFNHLYHNEITEYISRASKLLNLRGYLFYTCFLINPMTELKLYHEQTAIKFCEHDGHWASNQERPLMNTAISESIIRRTHIGCKLPIMEPIRYGQWCGSEQAITGHDVVIAQRLQ